MDETRALDALGAPAMETRLRIARLLVTAGREGLVAGAISDTLGAASSRLSLHLTPLEHAGLVRSWRDGRSVRCSADHDALSGLVAFLIQDCCQGRPEVCAFAVAALSASACPSPEPAE